jgi:hypothetical protein
MAHIWSRPEIKLKIGLELDEEEARALLILTEYNRDEMIKWLTPHLGERLIEKHRVGLMSILRTSREPLSMWISKVDAARKVFEEKI